MFSDVPFYPFYGQLVITFMKIVGVVNRTGHQIRRTEAGPRRIIVMFVWSCRMWVYPIGPILLQSFFFFLVNLDMIAVLP